MRIAVDARELTGRPTGVGRYLTELLGEWRASHATSRHDILLYSHAEPARLGPEWRSQTRVVPGLGGTRWEQWDFVRALGRDKPDVLFAPGYTAPLACPAPVVLSVHDVSFFAHPEWYSWREGLRRRRVTSWAARRARLVLTPSVFSGAEVVRHLGVPQERVRVVYLGVRPGRAGDDTREPVVLFVGSLFQRRRIDVLIDAFAAIAAARPDVRLEIVGENRTTPHVDFVDQVAGLNLGARVAVRHWVDDELLQALYAQAAVFVFLSTYEGFGLTPLEAMASGAVPIVLDTPVAREVYGGAAVRLDNDANLGANLAAAITRLLEGSAREPYRGEAPAVLSRYRWPDTAARTLRFLEEAAGA